MGRRAGAGMVFILACAFLFADTWRPEVVSIRIDQTKTYQTFVAWSAFLARWDTPHMYFGNGQGLPMDRVPAEVKTRILDLLYRDLKLNGIDVSLRGGPMDPSHISAPGSFRSHEPVNDNANPFVTDRSKLNFAYWGPLLSTVRKAFLRIRSRGEEPVLLLRVSGEEEWMKQGRELPADEYVEWILALLTYLRDEQGLPVTYVSVRNEPDGVGRMAADRMVDIILRLGNRIKTAGLDTKIAGPETVTPAAAFHYLERLGRMNALSSLGLITYHLYDYDPSLRRAPDLNARKKLRDLALRHKVATFMSEQSSDLKTNRRTFWMDTPQQALALANDFLTELTETDAAGTTCCMWTFWTDSNPNFGSDAFVILNFDKNAGYRFIGFRTTNMYRVLGKFIKTIRPGMIRIGATSNDPQVRVVTFRDVSAGRKVLVVLNNADSSRQLSLPSGRTVLLQAKSVQSFVL